MDIHYEHTAINEGKHPHTLIKNKIKSTNYQRKVMLELGSQLVNFLKFYNSVKAVRQSTQSRRYCVENKAIEQNSKTDI